MSDNPPAAPLSSIEYQLHKEHEYKRNKSPVYTAIAYCDVDNIRYLRLSYNGRTLRGWFNTRDVKPENSSADVNHTGQPVSDGGRGKAGAGGGVESVAVQRVAPGLITDAERRAADQGRGMEGVMFGRPNAF